jgi:hypothetical protein
MFHASHLHREVARRVPMGTQRFTQTLSDDRPQWHARCFVWLSCPRWTKKQLSGFRGLSGCSMSCALRQMRFTKRPKSRPRVWPSALSRPDGPALPPGRAPTCAVTRRGIGRAEYARFLEVTDSSKTPTVNRRGNEILRQLEPVGLCPLRRSHRANRLQTSDCASWCIIIDYDNSSVTN